MAMVLDNSVIFGWFIPSQATAYTRRCNERAPVAPRRLFELAEEHGISAYDAAYLELAARRGLPLATRDANLARAGRAAGIVIA